MCPKQLVLREKQILKGEKCYLVKILGQLAGEEGFSGLS